MKKLLPKDHIFKGIKTGSWSKYGGGNMGLQKEAIDVSWTCQACGTQQPKELDPYMFELFAKEFIRICGKCRNKVKTEDIKEFSVLKRVVTHTTWIIKDGWANFK